MLKRFMHQKTEEVRINIKEINQLFNSLDPSPFLDKDLDDDAKEYIVSSFLSFHHSTPVKIVIHIQSSQKEKFNEKEIKEAIHHFFQYEKMIARKNIKRKIQEGQKSLSIGLSFLFICLITREILLSRNQTFMTSLFSEALLILGWVSMWKPISNILYDWWPIHDMKKTYEKISKAEIDFVYGQ